MRRFSIVCYWCADGICGACRLRLIDVWRKKLHNGIFARSSGAILRAASRMVSSVYNEMSMIKLIVLEGTCQHLPNFSTLRRVI